MSQLPAHLQKYQAPDVGAALSQNLGSAMPPHVSIGGGRFTLIDASNNEIPVPTFDPKIGVYLDACIIDVNEKISRQYFAKPYDPSAPGTPPDCWSDNGVAASIGASAVPILQPPHPRAGMAAATCAECPMSVWGSKINPNGKAVPACSQKQKMALLIPGFQVLFLLAVPPNSHSLLREYVERSRGSGVNMADVITRISFVPGEQGTLQFSPVNYIDEPTAILRQAAYVEKKTDVLVGRNDVPRTTMLAAPVQPVQIASMQTLPANSTPQQVAESFANLQPSTQQVQQLAPFVPSMSAQQVASAAFPMPTAGPAAAFQQPAVGQLAEGTPTPRRRRRTAAEMQAAQPGAQAPAAAQVAPQQPAPASPGQMPQAPFPHPGQAVSQQPSPGATGQAGGFSVSQQLGALPGQTDMEFGMAPGTPVAANPEVSAMLDDFFKQG